MENGKTGRKSIIHYIVGWTMVFTGLLYPFSLRISFVGLFVEMFGEFGLLLWSVLMIGFGATLILRHDPRHTFILTLPLLVFLGITMKMALDGRSLSAMIYYSSLWVFLNLFDYLKLSHVYPDNWRKRVITWMRPKWVFAIIMGLMLAVLIILPYGSGLDYTYRYLSLLFDDPVTAYRVMFGVSTLGLLMPFVRSKFLIGLLCLSMWVHGGIFVVVILTETFAFAFLPMFFGNSVLWLSAIEEA